MSERRAAGLTGHIDDLISLGSLTGMDDEVLLRRFREDRDPRAFTAIVERYGPLVLRVCRDILANPHDTEDAFQATFLILVRESPAIRQPGALACWLHGVSRRVAIRIKRRHRAFRLVTDVAAETPSCPAELREELQIVHEAIDRLPEKYRLPVVLFHLEGLTHDETAARLRWPVGTVRGRLSRARDRLRRQFERAGLGGALLELGSTEHGALRQPRPPASLIESTHDLVVQNVPDRILSISQGVIQAMIHERLKFSFLLLTGLTISFLAGGIAIRGVAAFPQDVRREAPRVDAEARAQPQPGTVAAPAILKVDEATERAEVALDEKKVQAEILELEIEGYRQTIRKLRQQVTSMRYPPPGMGGGAMDREQRAKLETVYKEALQGAEQQAESAVMHFKQASIELGRLRRQIARDSRASGREIHEPQQSSSLDGRLRDLEEKVDRLLGAMEKNAR